MRLFFCSTSVAAAATAATADAGSKSRLSPVSSSKGKIRARGKCVELSLALSPIFCVLHAGVFQGSAVAALRGVRHIGEVNSPVWSDEMVASVTTPAEHEEVES